MSSKNIYEQALEKWGEDLQINVLGEECSELDKLTHKYARLKGLGDTIDDSFYSQMCDEVADVLIMIEQFKLMKPWIPEQIECCIKAKLARVRMWLEE